jgi:hypothetical protein
VNNELPFRSASLFSAATRVFTCQRGTTTRRWSWVNTARSHAQSFRRVQSHTLILHLLPHAHARVSREVNEPKLVRTNIKQRHFHQLHNILGVLQCAPGIKRRENKSNEQEVSLPSSTTAVAGHSANALEPAETLPLSSPPLPALGTSAQVTPAAGL